jgi:predicted acylesterase/phospholipase RssA
MASRMSGAAFRGLADQTTWFKGKESGCLLATYRILCCDGGGIRGLLTALVIRRLHSELGFLDRVDFYAGTSTGGIIAIGLAGGLGIDSIVELYQRKAAEIFRRPQDLGGVAGQFVRDRVREFARKIPNMKDEIIDSVLTYQNEMWNSKYSNEGLRKLVAGLFPTDPTLGTLPGKSKVLVTTFQLHDETSHSWRPVSLHNLATPGNDPHASHVVESVMCTSAAPTFFPPYKHIRLGHCIDGGVFANNPSSIALATALEAGIPRDSIRLLSIGTGGTRSSMKIPHFPLFQDANAYGIMGWLFPVRAGNTPDYPLLNILFDAGVSTSELLANQVLGSAFRRIQVPLATSIGFDDVEAMGPLKDAADAYFDSEAWPAIQAWVKRNFA